jgi:hypothetical protein
MTRVDPRTVVGNHEAVLDERGGWPSFHDAEVLELSLSRGEARPEDDIQIPPQITVRIEACALTEPFVATVRFEGCESIAMSGFNHQNPIMDLKFGIEQRGFLRNGEPMTPFIVVEFEPCWEFQLSFKCFKASVLNVERG